MRAYKTGDHFLLPVGEISFAESITAARENDTPFERGSVRHQSPHASTILSITVIFIYKVIVLFGLREVYYASLVRVRAPRVLEARHCMNCLSRVAFQQHMLPCNSDPPAIMQFSTAERGGKGINADPSAFDRGIKAWTVLLCAHSLRYHIRENFS